MMSRNLQQQAIKLNAILENLSTPQERLQYVLNVVGKSERVVLTTSFGIQSALMLHLVSTAAKKSSSDPTAPSVPVVWIDTGYLPKETYHFAEQLTHMLDLDLRTYQSPLSPARMEAIHGKLWEDHSDEAHKKYNYIRKVEPMKRALQELGATVVLSGVRAGQTSHRQEMKMVHVHDGRLKICPVLDWNDDQVRALFIEHGLPLHPLYEKGYRSVGDWHSSAPFDPEIHTHERETRFGGRTQECGLHIPNPEPEDNNNAKPALMFLSQSSSSLVSTESTMTTASNESDGFLVYTKPSCRFCKAAKALLQYLHEDEQIRQQKSQQDYGTNMSKDDGSTSSILSGASSSSSVFRVVEEVEVGKTIAAADLERILGRTINTVPQILYKGNYIGGYEDLVKWVRNNIPHVKLPNTVKLAELFRQQ